VTFCQCSDGFSTECQSKKNNPPGPQRTRTAVRVSFLPACFPGILPEYPWLRIQAAHTTQGYSGTTQPVFSNIDSTNNGREIHSVLLGHTGAIEKKSVSRLVCPRIVLLNPTKSLTLPPAPSCGRSRHGTYSSHPVSKAGTEVP
jgi:hypothetical protein